ncbi:glycerate kinase [Macrococcoides canis]|uniref:Glycerate kinase n=1 Tax=Macrococcoides canis TaxID=1855823 RepID=A0A1W7AAA6_9STAP|nr:glycerate kinase [Macrococcus canis]ARQ06346.1 Glycerate kinase [Macrococcus canis]UTH00683.1 glycerate kinase [Macrococcus canis]UTH12169.1 glycerate kinase [Macrococcus canis]
MKILIAMDTFFNTLYSHHANQYVYDGIKTEGSNVVMVPLFESDKNMIDALLTWEKGAKLTRQVFDGNLNETDIQVARVAHDTMLIDAGQFLNSEVPEETSSYGLGKLIMNGVDMGITSFIISLGNVTVFDAGAGMLQALGAKFYDRDHQLIDSVMHQGLLKFVRYMQFDDLDSRLAHVNFKIISDHEYHNYGKKSQISAQDYAFDVKQRLDNSIWYILQQFKKHGIDYTDSPYGGDGGALRTIFEQYFKADIRTSAQLIFERTHIETLLEEADMIIYGGGSNEETSGSLIVSEINKRIDDNKQYIYLSAGKQFLAHHIKDSVVSLNVYPEVTAHTEDIQIGLQLQQAIQNIMKLSK